MGPFVLTHPSSAADNTIQATADVPDLILRPFSDTQASHVFEAQNAAGTKTLTWIARGGDLTVGSSGGAGEVNFQTFDGVPNAGGIVTFAVYQAGNGFTAQINSASDTDVPFQIFGNSGTQAADMFQVYDKANTNAFAVKADGSVNVGKTGGKAGFLGAAPVVRQTGASAAAIAAIIDPNAKAAIGALQAALAALGLVTSPP